MMRVLVLDTETTGLGGPPNAGVCEIAWVEIDAEFNVINTVYSLIDPEMPIGASAAGVHGIMDKDVVDAPTLPEFFGIVKGDPFAGDEIILICHNVPFDEKFVAPFLPIAHKICTLRCSRRIYPEAPDHKLMTLKFALGLGEGVADAHSAAGDVGTTLALLKRLAQDTGLDLKGLVDLSNSPMPVTKISFGKHKGKKLSELPSDYVDWLLNKADNLDSDLRVALTKL